MKKKFEYKESYKHLMAKNLLASWLRKIDEEEEFCRLTPFSWRSNYGVFTELPFFSTSDPYYFEMSKGLLDPTQNDFRYRYDHATCFDPKINRGRYLFVPDITIFHKGTAYILIEVIHKNELTWDKIAAIDLFFNGNVQLFTIEAEEILRQTEVPKSLIATKIEL